MISPNMITTKLRATGRAQLLKGSVDVKWRRRRVLIGNQLVLATATAFLKA